MNKSSTLVLKTVIVLVGMAVLALCIFILPTGIVTDTTGDYRPILLGMYVTAIPFFIALYHGFRLLTYIEKGNIFSTASVKALNVIKYCGFVTSAVYAVGMPYIFNVAQKDDAPGVVLIGGIFIIGSLIVATAAIVFQRLLQNALDIKSENELTV